MSCSCVRAGSASGCRRGSFFLLCSEGWVRGASCCCQERCAGVSAEPGAQADSRLRRSPLSSAFGVILIVRSCLVSELGHPSAPSRPSACPRRALARSRVKHFAVRCPLCLARARTQGQHSAAAAVVGLRFAWRVAFVARRAVAKSAVLGSAPNQSFHRTSRLRRSAGEFRRSASSSS